jgi:nucleoid-associated protein YgaU
MNQRETRFGLAAVLSFVVLVSVMIINHNRAATKGSNPAPGKGVLVAQIAPGSAPDNSEPTNGKPDRDTPPTPTPVPAPVAVPEQPRAGKPSTEQVELAAARNEPPVQPSPAPLPPAGEIQGSLGPKPVAAPAPALFAAGEATLANDESNRTRRSPEPVASHDAVAVEGTTSTTTPIPFTPPVETAQAPADAPSRIGPGSPAPAPNELPFSAQPAASAGPEQSAPGSTPPVEPIVPAPITPAPELETPATSAPTIAEGGTTAVGPNPSGPTLLMPDPSTSSVPSPGRAETQAPLPDTPAEMPSLTHTAPAAPRSPEVVPMPPEVFKGPSSSAEGGSWVALPTVGRGRLLDDGRGATEQALARVEPSFDTGTGPAAGAGGVSSPRSERRETVEEGGQVEAVPHVVQRDENFWTISRLYYGSGRFYKALWSANRRTVPEIAVLYVGQTIRIPPPEALDRALIEPAKPLNTASGIETGSSVSRPIAASTAPLRKTSSGARAGRRTGDDSAREEVVALPTSDPFATRGEASPISDPEAPARYQVRRPRYKVRRYETLRSIARDTMGDSHRAGEILELNEAVIDDPNHLLTGQVLELPEDAKVGGRPVR